MPTLGRLQIPPPKDWPDFEEITLDALRIRWGSPGLEKNGRTGQAQAGVDVWGPDDLERPVGVQCKLTEGDLTLSVIEAEVEKAEKFKPPLAVFYVATTAKTDAKIQAAVRILSQHRVVAGKFAIGLIFWESLLLDLATNPLTFKKHYPALLLDTNHGSSPRTGARLLAILDVAYLGTRVDAFLDLLFGQFGAMTVGSEEEFARVLFAYRAAGPVVFEPSVAGDAERHCRELELAVEQAWRHQASWEPASVLAAKLRAIAEGLQYSLAGLELAVFEAGRMLGGWAFIEVDNRSITTRNRSDLELVLKKLLGETLPPEVTVQFELYDEDPDRVATVRIPDRIYQVLRRSLSMRELGLIAE